MISAALFLFVGLLMIFFEFYMPGGILGTLGGVAVIAAVVLFGLRSESILATLLFFLVAVAGIAGVIKFALWKIRHAEPGHSIYSEDDQEGFYASGYDREAIGKEGIVTTDLRPGGHIQVEGKRHSAISQSGYIMKGEKVKVVGGEGESLLVKKVI